MKKEIFIAGGCFWGVEAYFSRLKGIEESSSYYINGGFEGVSYKEVCTTTNHVEAVKIIYDSNVVSEKTIWDLYLNIVDPYSLNQQGNDKGTQYRVGIYSNDSSVLNEYKKLNDEFVSNEGKENYLEFLPISDATKAEEYHQKYLEKNPNGYCHINLYSIPEEFLKDQYKK
ncbi:methionine sulfoxide reductase A [Mycoplasmopsis canis UF31]|uniref:peptide-methionine (S)-S-oxide reductase MsrA n=1 Tax=Mycoplasmopsis canis TaxID=29555 RepID=UPI00025AD9A2|nr:peptide-methionine (S)-S-oxide reductase MsrA [Mycoplasmopsis canis]EIE41030.1 methionine sulfoxide reductase A [Mycoplasmopsis canis UF31]EIE41154.1 methionine sulfoxide reductase A [Mycoplasmopsis canis UF33]WQQ12634.1 peptide-methionine (S)-S-oxide reductase MsrA [Mycoplasmopsis canis]